MPKVSVVIPCYNHGEFLLETLNSVQIQTLTDFEIIVVNDGSTNAVTVDLLQHMNIPQTKVIHTANKGVSAARNRGISEARGDYILPLDADDKIGPTYLERAVALLETDPSVAVAYYERVLFGEREEVNVLPEYDQRALLYNNCIHATALFRKVDWEAVGGYSEKMVYGWEDWDFWLSISELNKRVVKLPEEFFYYRVCRASRDHSLTFTQKLDMFMIIMLRHKHLYLKHAFYVAWHLCAMHIFRLHR